MPRFLPLLLAGSLLWACSDSKNDRRDAGGQDDAGEHDASAPSADAGSGASLDQPEEKLERPPGEKLPDALKPPGFAH